MSDLDTLAATVREGLDHLYHAGEAPTEWLTTGLDALTALVEHARTVEREREEAWDDYHREKQMRKDFANRADRYEKALAEIAEAGCENVTDDMRECIETKRDRSNWCWPCIARAASLTDEQLEGARADARAALAGEDA